ncbi:TRAP transporter large permease subunit [Chloroflexota bacterium]
MFRNKSFIFNDPLSMIILSVPILAPIVQGLGFDLIWFGVIVTVTVEMALITPPVGMNLFVIKSILPEVPASELFAGAFPFVAAQLVCLVILTIFPQISLWLPSSMM